MTFTFAGSVWHYRNPNIVYFVSLPDDVSADIYAAVGTSLNPWGTVPVDATIDSVTWFTSMFPRDGGRYYDLPLRRQIVDKLNLVDEQIVSVRIAVRFP